MNNNMKKVIKLTESDLRRIVKRVIKENEELLATPGKYFALGGHYFFVNNGKMYLAEKEGGELKPNLTV